MNNEWMLNDNDDKHLYELLTLEDVFADQKIIAKFAQKKLLEYLDGYAWDHNITGGVIKEMLKQLEGAK